MAARKTNQSPPKDVRAHGKPAKLKARSESEHSQGLAAEADSDEAEAEEHQAGFTEPPDGTEESEFH